jgi:hypothetical protein
VVWLCAVDCKKQFFLAVWTLTTNKRLFCAWCKQFISIFIKIFHLFFVGTVARVALALLEKINDEILGETNSFSF